MKQFLIAAIVVLLIPATASHAQDAKAKSILESANKKMNSLKTLKAAFVLKLLGTGGKIRDTKKGSFLMKGQKYHIILTGQEIICDGKTVWTYIKDAKEVQVSNYNPSEQTMSPTKLFTNFYDKEYSYKYLGSRNVAGKVCEVIELVPINKTKQFTKVELFIDKANTIVGGNIFEKNGNQYRYEVNGFTANAAIADNLFSFNVKEHPGIEVVDLR